MPDNKKSEVLYEKDKHKEIKNAADRTDAQEVEYKEEYDYEEIPPAPPGRPTAAFVLGIASIVLCVLPFMLMAGVVGLLLEKESERTGYHCLQKPAKILCIIGIVMCSIAIAAILAGVFIMGILSR